jgi:hypothetical protein
MTASWREKLWNAADQLELSPFEKKATKASRGDEWNNRPYYRSGFGGWSQVLRFAKVL